MKRMFVHKHCPQSSAQWLLQHFRTLDTDNPHRWNDHKLSSSSKHRTPLLDQINNGISRNPVLDIITTILHIPLVEENAI